MDTNKLFMNFLSGKQTSVCNHSRMIFYNHIWNKIQITTMKKNNKMSIKRRNGKTDIWTDWHMDKLKYGQTDIWTNWHLDKLAYRQTKIWTDWHMNLQSTDMWTCKKAVYRNSYYKNNCKLQIDVKFPKII